MDLYIRVNGEDTVELASWNNQIFNNEMYLDLLSDDLREMKDIFHSIETLEVINAETVVAEFTVFNTYDSISYLGERFIDRIRQFRDVLRVTLSRTNIIEQVQRLDAKINNVVDTESMNVNEYRAYILKQVSDACEADIYAGEHVELEDGSAPNFSYTSQDQHDLKALFDTALMLPQMQFSWHADGQACRLFSAQEIVKIYATLQSKLLQATTYCNAINQLAIQSSTKEALAQLHYGMELPTEIAENVEAILTEMSQIFIAMMENISGGSQAAITPTNIEPEEPEGSEESIEGEDISSGDGETPVDNGENESNGNDEPEDEPGGENEPSNENE